MNKCGTCKTDIKGKLKVIVGGYVRKNCRKCLNKKSLEHGRKKAEMKKKYRLW